MQIATACSSALPYSVQVRAFANDGVIMHDEDDSI